MEEASRKLARGDAAAAAVDLIEELIGREGSSSQVGRRQLSGSAEAVAAKTKDRRPKTRQDQNSDQ